MSLMNDSVLIANISSPTTDGSTVGNQSLLAELGFPRRSMTERVIWSIVLVMILMTSLVGNTLVIACVRLNSRLREENSNLFIVNLSVTDMLSAVIVMGSSLHAMASDQLELNSVLCDLVCGANYTLIIVSMLTLCFISLDRYMAIIHSMHYHTKVTRNRILVLIAYAWFQGLCFGTAPVIARWVRYDYWEIVCAIVWHEDSSNTLIYVVVAFLVCFLTPGVVLVHAYTKVMRVANRISNEHASARPRPLREGPEVPVQGTSIGNELQTTLRPSSPTCTDFPETTESAASSIPGTVTAKVASIETNSQRSESNARASSCNVRQTHNSTNSSAATDLSIAKAGYGRVVSLSSNQYRKGVLRQSQTFQGINHQTLAANIAQSRAGQPRERLFDEGMFNDSLIGSIPQAWTDTGGYKSRRISIADSNSFETVGSQTATIDVDLGVGGGRLSRTNSEPNMYSSLFEISRAGTSRTGSMRCRTKGDVSHFTSHRQDDSEAGDWGQTRPCTETPVERLDDVTPDVQTLVNTMAHTPDDPAGPGTNSVRPASTTQTTIMADTNNKRANKKNYSASSKAVRSLLVVVMAYFICMTPFSVTKLYKGSRHPRNQPRNETIVQPGNPT